MWKMIDIKTLRIGSHVEYEGKRVRICSLKTNMANYDNGKGKPHCFSSNLAYYKRMSPILITPKLLEELGFEWKDEGCWQHWWKGGFDLTRRGESPYWDYEGDISVQYLHKLENLYYLIYGQELIPD